MRPTFLGFETARRGLVSTQKRLDITGHNLTNIKTEGYTRQRVDVVSISPYDGSSMYAVPKSALAGQGVDVRGVSQIRDPFLDKRFREEYSDVGYFDQAAAILDDVEAALDEVTSKGLKNALKGVINAVDTFASNSDQVTHANIVMTAVKTLAQTLNQYSTKLDNVDKQQKFDLEITVNETNSYIEQIALLNKNISDDIFSSSLTPNEYFGPNELYDKRNVLLDKLSKNADIKISSHPDGTVTVEMDGKKVVDGSNFEQLTYEENKQTGAVSVNWLKTGKPVSLNSGSIKAFTEMINGKGSKGNAPFTKGIPYFKDQLDCFARQFADIMNNAFPTGTVPPVTDPPTKPDYKQLISGDPISGFFTAGNISITDEWINNPALIISDKINGGADFVDGILDNKFILALKDSFSNKWDFGEFKGTMEEFINSYNNTIGQEKSFYKSRMEACASVADDLLDRRDSISGVSTDEEGADLMVFDKAYKAISRVMTTLDEALDILINKTGLVGR